MVWEIRIISPGRLPYITLLCSGIEREASNTEVEVLQIKHILGIFFWVSIRLCYFLSMLCVCVVYLLFFQAHLDFLLKEKQGILFFS